MDLDQQRIEEARARNLAYIRRLDEEEAARAADEFLKQHAGGNADNDGEPRKRPASRQNLKNTSVYITGLSTYMACKQLEGVCAMIGKVRRTKFYKDDRGGLKGDALVTFASHNMMAKAVEKLNHFEIKPGVLLTATEAHFGSSKAKSQTPDDGNQAAAATQEPPTQETPMPERLFQLETLHAASDSADCKEKGFEASDKESKDTAEESKSTELSLPSRSVILSHVWDPIAPQEDATGFFSELEEDMREECGKHGPVAHVHILPNGGVMIRYETLAGAIKCLKVMHGRWFDGRQLEAQFDPSTPEEPDDDDTKLDAFFASLG